MNEFGACFTRAQEQAARPWSFIPNAHGGIFSDGGAKRISAPYRLQFSEARPLSQMQLFVARGAPNANNLIEAVNRCR